MAKKVQRALEPPHMTILSDHPILRLDEEKERREPDSFTLHSRLGAVYDIIRHKNTRAPLAIAVYGDWGTGKSSAMRWLSDQLGEWSQRSKSQREGHHRARTVWFDPWKYTKREDVWRGLIAEVVLNAIDIRKASLPTVLNAARKFGLFLGRSFLNILSSAELTVGAKEIGAEAKVDLEALTKIAEDYRQTAHPEKAFLNEFESALREWVRSSLADDERMVIFIDDLDRCLPEVVLEVLEALKLYLNIPQLIFVVGLDREVVESVVKDHYKKHGLGESKAEHYLDKMFQVEVDIPPSQTQMEGYLSLQITAMNEVADGYWSRNLTAWEESYQRIIEDKIGTLAEDNPREVKRLLNSTLLRGTAAARHEDLAASPAQRFTQGCQVYLMQRVLRKYVEQSAGLLRERKALAFFEQWSQFIQRYPDYRKREDRPEDEPPERAAGKGKEKPGDDQAAKDYEELRAALPRYRDTNEVYPLLGQPDLWDLLAIPFSAEVAAAAAIERSESEEAEAPMAEAGAVEAEAAASVEAPPVAKAPTAPAAGADLARMPRSLRSEIARSLNKPVGKLRADDLRSVVELDLSRTFLSDLTLLPGLTGLTTLDLSNMRVSDLTALAGLTALTTLHLRSTQVSDVTPLTGLTRLTKLGLGGTQVADLTPLAGLTTLTMLDLRGTQVLDLTPLAGLTRLTKLDLRYTHVSDLTPLSGLTGLTTLYLGRTEVSDLTPLARLTGLRKLDLGATHVSNPTALAGLKGLTVLYLWDTEVSDLTPLAGLVNLEDYQGPPIPGHPRFGAK